MSKQAANNVTRNSKNNGNKLQQAFDKSKQAEENTYAAEAAEALKTEAKAAEAEAKTAEAEAAEVGKAEAAKAESAVDVSEVEAASAAEAEAAEALKAEAEKALKTAEAGKAGKRSKEEMEAEKASIIEKRAKLAAEKEERLKAIAAEAEALKEEEELNAMRKELEAEEQETEALKSMSAEDFLKQSQQKALSSDIWELAFTSEGKAASEMQDKLFLSVLEMNGNSVEQVKVVRDYWKSKSNSFRAINADDTTKGDKKQKAIMRRVINRLKDNKRILKDGTKLSINKDWKAEESKSEK